MTSPKILTPEQIAYKQNVASKVQLLVERRYLHRICGSRHLAAEIWTTQLEDKAWGFASKNQYGYQSGYAAIARTAGEARTMAIDLRSRP